VGLIITSGLYVALIRWKLLNAVIVMVLVLARSLASWDRPSGSIKR
jgi:hypothetical protein